MGYCDRTKRKAHLVTKACKIEVELLCEKLLWAMSLASFGPYVTSGSAHAPRYSGKSDKLGMSAVGITVNFRWDWRTSTPVCILTSENTYESRSQHHRGRALNRDVYLD